jgi:RNA polymerase sigma-70 factor (ECF subfamily)
MAIVTRAQAGDLGAQSTLVRRYSARIAGFVRPIIAQPDAVEDVVQMVLIKMVRRLELLRDPITFESWLFALARNTALDFIRRRRCRPTLVSDDDKCVQTPYIDSSRALREITEALDLALTRLSPKDRSLVMLIVEGSSYRAAAQREGLSVGAVKLRLNRVRPFLRESIGGAIGLRSRDPESLCPPLRDRAAA